MGEKLKRVLAKARRLWVWWVLLCVWLIGFPLWYGYSSEKKKIKSTESKALSCMAIGAPVFFRNQPFELKGYDYYVSHTAVLTSARRHDCQIVVKAKDLDLSIKP